VEVEQALKIPMDAAVVRVVVEEDGPEQVVLDIQDKAILVVLD
jgi:hypothetical protein